MRAGGAQLAGRRLGRRRLRPPVERHPAPRRGARPRSAASSSCSPTTCGAPTAARSRRFPGDNGNWTDYDNFLTRLFNDVRAAGLTVQWDIWNEPNITLFWNRPQAQYFELWRRTYQRIRAAFPTHAHRRARAAPACRRPAAGGRSTWTSCKANNVVPDIVSWHSLPGDPVANVATANTTLDSRGIAAPAAVPDQRVRRVQRAEPRRRGVVHRPAGAGRRRRPARQLGRRRQPAQRPGQPAHPQLQPGSTSPRASGGSYRFYGSQTGQIVSVTPSASYDAFATKASGSAKILVGGGRTTGNVAVNLQRLDTTSGIVQNNQVRVVVQRIPYNSGGAVAGPGHGAGQRGDAVRQRDDGQRAAHQRRRHVHHHAAAAVGRRPAGQQIVGGQSGRCVDVPNATHHQRHAGAAVGLQRPGQPALDATRRAGSCRCTATSAWTPTGRARPTAPR